MIAAYPKTHLYYEPFFDAGPGHPVYFDTDFGVRLGTFVCFDIMFEHPMMDLLQVRFLFVCLFVLLF